MRLAFVVFFFPLSGDNRHLPSFPTRRSSDLAEDFGRAVAVPAASSSARPSVGASASGSKRTAARRSRSEEHTSELQSQSNLVCRLLLEKKKQNTNSMSTCTLNDIESTASRTN